MAVIMEYEDFTSKLKHYYDMRFVNWDLFENFDKITEQFLVLLILDFAFYTRVHSDKSTIDETRFNPFSILQNMKNI